MDGNQPAAVPRNAPGVEQPEAWRVAARETTRWWGRPSSVLTRCSRGTRLVALSGPVCAGKTALCEALVPAGFLRASTRGLLLAARGLTGGGESRLDLQGLGDDLDREFGGRWVAEPVGALLCVNDLIAVDAVRTQDQVNALRSLTSVLHVHLDADEAVLLQRYRLRAARDQTFETSSLQQLRKNATEAGVHRLGDEADLRIDTSKISPTDAARMVEVEC